MAEQGDNSLLDAPGGEQTDFDRNGWNGELSGKAGQVLLDQIRTVDKKRLVKKLGKVDQQTQKEVLVFLSEMFAS